MENQRFTPLGEESVSETPKPRANSTAFPEDLLSSRASLRNLSASSNTKENNYNSLNQFSSDCDERSSLSSFRSRTGTEFSKSSLGIVNVDQISDYCTSILTDFEKDNDSIVSSGLRSRKSDIEHRLRQSYDERFSLGQCSSKNESDKDLPSLQRSVSLTSSKNSSNFMRNSISNKNEKEDFFRSSDSDINRIDYSFKSSLGKNNELLSFSKSSITEKNKMENFFKDSSNNKMDWTGSADKLPSSTNGLENYFVDSVKDSNEADSIFNFKMDSASLQSFGFADEEFQNHNSDVFLQELEKDEKLAKKDNSIVDQIIDGSLSGIMSSDMAVGPEDGLSMSDYLKNKCHSLSELDRSPLATVKELDEFPAFLENTRKSISDDILSDESVYNWSRIQRGSLCKESFGVDLNTSSTSSIVSITEIAKMIRERSSATPRTIINALFAEGDAKNHRADKNYQGQMIRSSQSGIASNHSPPERDVEPSYLTRSSSSCSLQTDELCNPLQEAKSKLKRTSVDRITIDRTSLNSCKSLPVSNPPLYCNGSQPNSSPPLSSFKSARLSVDDRFLSAHSTPSDHKSVPNRKQFIPGSKSNLDKNESQDWSSYSLIHKSALTPACSSVKGSDFELALSAPSTVSKFGSTYSNSYAEFCKSELSNTNNEVVSAVSNSDNEQIMSALTPSSSSSANSKKHFGSNHSKTIINSSKNESTLTPGKIDANLSGSSQTSQTLTRQNRNEAALRKHKNDKHQASSASSFAGQKDSGIYRSSDSIDMKLNNQEYLPFESSGQHATPCQQTSTNFTDMSSFSEDQEFLNFKSDGSNESSCRFWLSDSENLDREEHNHSLSTVNYTIDTMSDCNDNETSQLSSLTGSLLTEVLSNSSITCELDGEKSRIKLNLGDGDTDRADDYINAGIHCIGTPVDVVVPVLNKSKYDIIWQISYELTPVDCNQSAVNLAQVIVPQKTFTVPSNRKSNVHLIIIPLLATAIDVTLKIESLYKLKSGVRSVEKSSISQNIRLIGEDPQLSIVSSSGVIYFGKLPNGCVESENIILQNTGHSRLPVKFSIEDGGKAEVYQGHTIIEAGDTWSDDINLFAFIKSASETTDNDGASYIYGILKIRLNVDPNIIKGPQSLCIIQLKAHVFPVNLLYSSLCSPLILTKPETSHVCSEALDIRNGSKIPLSLSVSVKLDDENLKSCFDIRPSRISMSPDQLVRFVVSFNTKKCTLPKVNADIYLQVDPKGIVFKSPVEVLVAPISMSKAESTEKLNSSDKYLTSSSSSNSRSTSPASSIASAVGQMQLACDKTCLVWSSVALHHSEIQSCTVKNCGAHREKLLFQLSDNSNCFKIVKSEKDSSYVSEIKMSLNPSECKKLSVALFSSIPHTQAYGRVTITRFGQDHDSSIDSNGIPVKRVLPLYGFCGSSNMRMTGLNKDVEDRLWIYPDSETFESSFLMENIGDSAAFLKIVPEQFSDDYVKPTEHILLPNESTTINFAVNLSAFRIEKLLEKQKNKDVVQVSRLLLYYGNESIRKRIKRIWAKCKKKGIKLEPDTEQKLHLLSTISYKCDLSVDKLYDPIENVSALLDEIEVVQIGVLMERTALESALLDTSPVFNDLNTTVREVSIMSPASSVNVEPQTLSLPVGGKTQVLNVSNSTGHDASFHAVFPPELSVNPSKGSLKAYAHTQLTVTHVGPKSQNSRFEQKLIRIISDRCETKVAVEIRHEQETEDFVRSSIYSNDYNIVFPATVINHKSIIAIRVCNTSQLNVLLVLANCDEPFYVPSENFLLKKKWYCNFRVFFRPQALGVYEGHATFNVLHDGKQISTLKYDLTGEAIGPK